MDFGYAPATDGVTTVLREMVSRRIPPTTVVDAKQVRDFIKGRNDDVGQHPVGDLVISAHANSEGKWFVRLFDGQKDNAGKATERTDFENLEQTLEAGALTRRIRIDDVTVGFTAPPPTHILHIKGCNLGKSEPFLTKLKEALGGHVLVSAPKHFQAAYGLAKKGNNGSFEFMSYEFQVQTPARVVAKKFVGFATRADLIAAFVAAGHQYISGAVPDADWEKLVPDKIAKTQTFHLAVPLGGTVAGLKELVLSPDPKTGLGGGRQFRVYLAEAGWAFTPPSGSHAAKVAALKTKVEADPRYKSFHEWPFYERVGFASVDEYMDGHHWTFDANAGHRAPVRVHRGAPGHRHQRSQAQALLQLLPGHRRRAGRDHERHPARRPALLQAGLTGGRRRRPGCHRWRARPRAPAARGGDELCRRDGVLPARAGLGDRSRRRPGRGGPCVRGHRLRARGGC